MVKELCKNQINKFKRKMSHYKSYALILINAMHGWAVEEYIIVEIINNNLITCSSWLNMQYICHVLSAIHQLILSGPHVIFSYWIIFESPISYAMPSEHLVGVCFYYYNLFFKVFLIKKILI